MRRLRALKENEPRRAIAKLPCLVPLWVPCGRNRVRWITFAPRVTRFTVILITVRFAMGLTSAVAGTMGRVQQKACRVRQAKRLRFHEDGKVIGRGRLASRRAPGGMKSLARTGRNPPETSRACRHGCDEVHRARGSRRTVEYSKRVARLNRHDGITSLSPCHMRGNIPKTRSAHCRRRTDRKEAVAEHGCGTGMPSICDCRHDEAEHRPARNEQRHFYEGGRRC